MKITNIKTVLGTLFLITVMTLTGCGGGSQAPSSSIVNLADANGSNQIGINSSFQKSFAAAIDTSTVTASSFFMFPSLSAVPAISAKSLYNSSLCDPNLAIAATVECSSSTECILDPAEDLLPATSYSVCLTTDILSSASISPKAGAPIAAEIYSFATSDGTVVYPCIDTRDCPTDTYCFFGSCKPNSQLGIFGPCNSESDCAIDKYCLDNLYAEDCSLKVCVMIQDLLNPENGAPQTREDCEAKGFKWEITQNICMTKDVEICQDVICGSNFLGTSDCTVVTNQTDCEQAYYTNTVDFVFQACEWNGTSCVDANQQCTKGHEATCHSQEVPGGDCSAQDMLTCNFYYYLSGGVKMNCIWSCGESGTDPCVCSFSDQSCTE